MPSPPEPRRLLAFRPTLGQGGADRVTLSLLAGFDRRRLSPALALLRAEGALLAALPPDVPLHALDAASTWTGWLPLARLLRRERPDILFATSRGGNVAAVAAALAVRFPGRLVVSERSLLVRDEARLKSWTLAALKRLLYRRADVVTAVSEGVRRDVLRRLGLPQAKVVTTYNPVVTAELAAAASEPLTDPGAPGSGPWILAAGRLEAVKDFSTLVRAFALVSVGRPVRLVILGDGPERPRLQALAAELGCAASVRLPGYDPNPFRWMARCTLFALSSRSEGLPGALIEAMACGAPVVATDCPTGPAEVVEHGRNGMLVPVGDVAELARALGELLDDPVARARMAARGQETSGRFRLEAVLPRYEEVLLGGR